MAKHHTVVSMVAPRSWALWQARTRVWALVLVVDAAAVLLGVSTFLRGTVTASDLLRFGLLAALGVLYLEVSRQVEQRRLFLLGGSSHIDMGAVWTLAGALVLPPSLAVGLVALTYLHIWARSWRHVDGELRYRTGYTTATLVITVLAASEFGRLVAGGRIDAVVGRNALLAAVVAILTYRAVNRALIVAAIACSSGLPRWSQLGGSLAANALEFSTLMLGAATALLVVRVPPLALLVLPAAFLLQHRALLKQLVEAATIDVKTELLNAAAWRQLAERELHRAARQDSSTAVLVIDMDHFKQLNDTYGHLAGDEALKAIGEALADELRGYDAVGRFGGEEFVALLPGVDGPRAAGVAERVRARIESLQVAVERSVAGPVAVAVTASIGVAAARGAVELDDLLRAADTALYDAKSAGRNAVRRAPMTVTPAA